MHRLKCALRIESPVQIDSGQIFWQTNVRNRGPSRYHELGEGTFRPSRRKKLVWIPRNRIIVTRIYKVEILRSSSRVINSIDTRKFHGDELQKPIPRPNPCDHFRFLFRTPDWREWRLCPAKKWRQRCPDFSIVIVIRLGETSVWYHQEMEYYADYDSFVVF